MNLRTLMLVVLAVGVALAVAVAVQASPKDAQILYNLVVFEVLVAFPFVVVFLRVVSGPRP